MNVFNTKEFFKGIAEANRYNYSYGKKGAQNLESLISRIWQGNPNKEKFLFCNELRTDDNFVRVELILGQEADYGQDYDQAYNTTQKMKEEIHSKIIEYLHLWNVRAVMTIEVVNEKDINVNGVLCQFEMENLQGLEGCFNYRKFLQSCK